MTATKCTSTAGVMYRVPSWKISLEKSSLAWVQECGRLITHSQQLPEGCSSKESRSFIKIWDLLKEASASRATSKTLHESIRKAVGICVFLWATARPSALNYSNWELIWLFPLSPRGQTCFWSTGKTRAGGKTCWLGFKHSVVFC